MATMYQNKHQEEEQGSINYIIKTAPLALDSNDPDVIEVGNYYLPQNTGIELECDQAEHYDPEVFLSIPDIVDVKVDKSEQRYQIPSGIKGINCLYRLSLALKEYSLLNYGSGNHYHVDLGNMFDIFGDTNHSNFISKVTIEELSTWNYKGQYNTPGYSLGSHTWARRNGLGTYEVRIGEMTFDYKLLFKRITHCHAIVEHIKASLSLEYYKKEMPSVLYVDNVREVLKHRTKKI